MQQILLSAISGLAFPRCSYNVISNNKNASSGWIRLSFPIPVLKQTPTITLVLSCPSPSPGTAQMLISMVIMVIFIILILSINLFFWIKVHLKWTNEFVRFVFEMTIHNVICSFYFVSSNVGQLQSCPTFHHYTLFFLVMRYSIINSSHHAQWICNISVCKFNLEKKFIDTLRKRNCDVGELSPDGRSLAPQFRL